MMAVSKARGFLVARQQLILGMDEAVVVQRGKDGGEERFATKSLEEGEELKSSGVEEGDPPWEVEEEMECAAAESLGFSEVGEEGGLDEAYRVAVVYENERFNGLSRSWSSGALLPTDRRAYSSSSGKKNWRTLESATSELLGKHWTWIENDWQGSVELEYASDFGTFKEARAQPGRFDFVRRRRLQRTARLRLVREDEERCPRVDPGAETTLTTKLKQVLSVASLVASPEEDCDDDEILTSKTTQAIDELVETLGLSEGGFVVGDEKRSNLALDISEFQSSIAKKFPMSSSKRYIAFFNNNSGNNGGTQDRDAAREESERRAKLERLGALSAARAVARAAVRAYDPSGMGACDGRHGDERARCLFLPVRCPSCGGIFSKRAASDHDALCDRKRVPCEACGALVERRMTSVHRTRDCSKRAVRCPYGCTHSLLACDLAAHLDAATPGHCLLLLERSDTAAESVKQHDDRLIDLEKKVADLESRLCKALDVAQTAQSKLATIAAVVQSFRLDLHAEIKANVDAATKALEKKVKTDIAAQTKPIPAIQRSLAALERNLDTVIKEKRRNDDE